MSCRWRREKHSIICILNSAVYRQVGGLPSSPVEMINKRRLWKWLTNSSDRWTKNVHPQFYGEKRLLRAMIANLVRDEFELALLKEAPVRIKPIMAICRGVQLVNAALAAISPRNWRPLVRLTFWNISFYWDSRRKRRLSHKESQVNSSPSSKYQDSAPISCDKRWTSRLYSRSDWVCRRASYYWSYAAPVSSWWRAHEKRTKTLCLVVTVEDVS